MYIVDTHCDTIMRCLIEEGFNLKKNIGHIDVEKLKAGRSLAQCFALFMLRDEFSPEEYKGLPFIDIYEAMLGAYRREMEANKDILRPALNAADIEKNKADGFISSILTVEDGVAIEGKIERVKKMYDDGVRLITLTWNYENSIGYPNSADHAEHMRGLKPFGIEAVQKMNELGIAVDVSHLSEGGFYDIVKHANKPFIASHSCARALCDESRNLTDEQLKKIGETGSIVGVNFYSGFLNLNSEYTSYDDIVKHAVYMADKAGLESICLGSDFDGIDNELEMKDFTGMVGLIEALNKKFTADQVDMIANGNAMRFIKDVMK